jgi:serine/threonine-protein kinase
MPFVNQSTDPDTEYFSDGMTDELINALAAIPGLKVVGRSSVFRFKGQDYDVKQVGEALNVDTVLEGTVRKSGDRLRITAQLINAEDGFELWADRFESEMKDVFDIQDEVCRAMVETLQVRLVGDSQQPLVRRYTDNLEAYNLYLRGRIRFQKPTNAEMTEALELFEQAKQLDPEYPLPYAGAARAYVFMSISGQAAPGDYLLLAEAEVARALEIDDSVASTQTALGFVRMYQWDWLPAKAAFQRAISVEPGQADAHQFYARLLSYLGRAQEALDEARRAVELDPMSPMANYRLAMCFNFMRRYDRAIRQANASVDLAPRFFLAYHALTFPYSQQGRHEDAIQAIEQGRAVAGDNPLNEGIRASVYGRGGRREQALEIVNELKRRQAQRYTPAFAIAMAYAGLDDADAMFHWMEKAYEEREPVLPIINDFPLFDPYRSDPRYQDLVKRMNFPE